MRINTALRSYKIWFPLLVLIAVLTLIMPRNGKFEYVFSKGVQWNYPTLRAAFDFPILKTAEQIEEEKGAMKANRQLYYSYSTSVWNSLSEQIRSIDNGDIQFSHKLIQTLLPLYEKGVIYKGDLTKDDECSDIKVINIQRDKKILKVPCPELYSVDQVFETVHSAFQDQYSAKVLDSLLQQYQLLYSFVPNVVFDSKMTENVNKEKLSTISPSIGIFKSGNVIVSTGEMVTADIEQILNSYKIEFEESVGYQGPKYLIWLGNLGMAIILVISLVILISFSKRDLLLKYNEFYFILTLFFLCSLVTVIISRLENELYLLVPYPVFALFLMAFYRRRFVMPLYMIMILPILICAKWGAAQLYMHFLFGGFIAVETFSFWNRGWKQFIASLLTFAAMLLAFVDYKLLGGSINTLSYTNVIYIFLSALFCILAYPLVYLFEICFNLVSSARLIDLADTNNELLRNLARKAPGTFQHSIAVMNMAEYAGRSVEADIPLLRAGALYHDMGKMENSQNFVENQNGEYNVKEGKSLKESAQAIIAHVADGLSIAEKYSLPKVVADFIATHHGTTFTGYFYNKYLNDGGDPKDVAEFFYTGPKPSTREQIILMLCDSVEAASRTINDYSPEAVSKFVDSIYAGKYHDGQFGNADITLRELDTVSQAIKDYLVQSHHQRIVYPNIKKKK